MENNIKKSIEISASDDKVWNTLTRDEYVRQWANAFEGGTYVESDFTENAIVTWKNKEGRNMVKGRVQVRLTGQNRNGWQGFRKDRFPIKMNCACLQRVWA